MNKYEFLAAIREGLDGMEKSDIDRTLDYYREIIDDKMDNGLSEEEAIASLGSVKKIIADIRQGEAKESADTTEEPAPKAAPTEPSAEAAPVGRTSDEAGDILRTCARVLLVIVGIAFWCVAVSTLIAGVVVGLASLPAFFSSLVMLFTGNGAQFALMLGGALASAGIGILMTVGTVLAMRYYKRFYKKIRAALNN